MRTGRSVCVGVLAVVMLIPLMGVIGGCPPTLMPVEKVVSFSADIQPIFDENCIVCHSAEGLAGDMLILTAGESYDALTVSHDEDSMMGEMGHEEELAGDHMEDEMGHEEEPAGDHMGDEDLHAAQEADDHDMSAHSAYVVPGEAHESLLYQKVSMDSPPMGESMPYGGPPLSDEQVDLIGDWIDQGAPNN